MNWADTLLWLRTRVLTVLLVLGLIEDRPESPSVTCPQCRRTSHHPDDVRFGFCAVCKQFHSRMGVQQLDTPYQEGL